MPIPGHLLSNKHPTLHKTKEAADLWIASPDGPFAALLARMAALSCFPVVIWAFPIFPADPANQTYSARCRELSRANLGSG